MDLTPTKDISAVADYLQKFGDLWGATQANILRAQASQRTSANKRRPLGEFSQGDKVMLSTKNIKLAKVESNKLEPRWIGPFIIISKKNPTVYKLQLPPTLQIYDTFHISLLKPFIESTEDNATYKDLLL